MKILSLFLLVFLLIIPVHGQGIKGQITDLSGSPVSFSNIYVPALKKGTASNLEGFFELKLPDGEWEVQFTYLGYKTQKQLISVYTDFTEINIILQPPQSY